MFFPEIKDEPTEELEYPEEQSDHDEDEDDDFGGQPKAKKSKKVKKKPGCRKKERTADEQDSDWEESKAPRVTIQEDDDIYERGPAAKVKKRKFLGNTHLLFPKYTSEMVVGK